jgi:HK97 family phage portal protein
MGLFTKLFEHRNNLLEDPSKPLTAGVLNTVFGWMLGGSQTSSGEVVSEFTAMQHVTVYACVRTISESIGSLTLRTYKREGKGRSEVTEDPIWRMLSLTPNDEMSAAVLWENAVGCMALCGNAYLEILRNGSGDALQIYPLHPLKTEPVRLPTGKVAYKTTSGMAGNAARIINAEDMLHFRLFSYDGLKGLSPIQQCKQTIGWSVGALKSSARFFGNGSTPPGILTPVGNVSDQDLNNMRKAWELANSGENGGRTAVLPSDWKFNAIGINAKDAQFLETMQFSRSDIAQGIFRVPAHMVGDTSKVSNNNVTEMNRGFVLDCLRPYLVKIEQEIAIKLLGASSTQFVEFDTSERLRGDYKTTMDGLAVGRQWGIYTTNYCLEQIGENPIGPEGDIRLVPVNMQNADRLLDTESIQDQPVDVDPNAPGVGDTKQMRNYFAHYSKAYSSLFSDAVGRALTRSKRDIDTLTPIFSPVLDAITELMEEEARSQFCLSPEWHGSDKTTRDYLKSMSTRATDWAAENKQQITDTEIRKALRSIYIGIYRDAGAAVAERGLEHGEDAA